MAFDPFPPPQKVDSAFGRDSLDDRFQVALDAGKDSGKKNTQIGEKVEKWLKRRLFLSVRPIFALLSQNSPKNRARKPQYTM